MTFSIEFGILFLVALVCCIIGFYKYVYFISIGYGLAISGQGAAMLLLLRLSRSNVSVYGIAGFLSLL